ncbi:MAG: hypothetical protein R3C61_00065 [Bacteroidia bacterium]
MKPIKVLLLTFVAAAVSSCTGSKYASSSEYDDVYFTSADKVEVAVDDQDNGYSNEQQSNVYSNPDQDNYVYNADRYRRPVDNYNDAYYQDDDFYYSRRVRRFSQSSNAWRYYDPYYTNDLYYVMGSPAWNQWNNYGWYDWNRPRFGASFSWGSPGFYSYSYNPYSSFYGGYGYYDYFNPWVSSYYGYNPGFGYNPYGGFNSFGYGYGGGFYSPYYCPPTGFVPASNWRRYSTNTQTYTTRVRNSTQSSTSQTNYTPRTGDQTGRIAPSTTNAGNNSPRNAANTRTTASGNDYLTPRYRTEGATVGRTGAVSPATGRTGTTSSPRVYTRPETNTNNNARVDTNQFSESLYTPLQRI